MADIQILYEGPVVKRKEAKSLGLRKYFTGKPCKHGHLGQRYTVDGRCVKCTAHNSLKAYHSKGPGKLEREAKRKREAYWADIEKSRDINKLKYYRNRENCLNRAKKYLHIRRASEGKFTSGDIENIISRQNNKCAEPTCMANLNKTGYHIDHIMPIALGGTSWPSNLQCLCPTCNLKKNAKHPIDWARENGRLL